MHEGPRESVSARFDYPKGGFWPEFERRYPDAQGFFTLSRTAFSRDGSQALLYVGNQSDGLAGVGYVMWLRWESDRWAILATRLMWIS